MDRVLRHAISEGLDPVTALQMMTINTAAIMLTPAFFIFGTPVLSCELSQQHALPPIVLPFPARVKTQRIELWLCCWRVRGDVFAWEGVSKVRRSD